MTKSVNKRLNPAFTVVQPLPLWPVVLPVSQAATHLPRATDLAPATDAMPSTWLTAVSAHATGRNLNPIASTH